MTKTLEEENEVKKLYSKIRMEIPDIEQIAILHIGEEITYIIADSPDHNFSIIKLLIGSEKTSIEYFKHNPPTEAEIDRAINVVEDEVIRAHEMTKDVKKLFTTDKVVKMVAEMSGVNKQIEMKLSKDEMERVFSRLAAVSLGRSASMEGIPEDSKFASTLLILREIMHHLGFDDIIIKSIL
jgi:hypothetical protein